MATALQRVASIRENLAKVQSALDEATQEAPPEEPAVDGAHNVSGPLERCVVLHRGQTEIVVTIGTSKDAQTDPGLIDRICKIVSTSYTAVGKSKRMDQHDALDRLEMGDDGIRANRVLHLAYKGGQLVGCASSTFSPGWTPEGCGHWGLLAVDPAHQGGGVATALVIAAERRLATVSELIQIEFRHTEGDAFCHRLLDWYEKLGFQGRPRRLQPGECDFLHVYKPITEDRQRWGRKHRLLGISNFLGEQLAEAEAAAAMVAI